MGIAGAALAPEAPYRCSIVREFQPAIRIRVGLAVLSEPLVSKGVAELVGMQARQAHLLAPALHHHDQTPRGLVRVCSRAGRRAHPVAGVSECRTRCRQAY
jgi:hypothetical protein